MILTVVVIDIIKEGTLISNFVTTKVECFFVWYISTKYYKYISLKSLDFTCNNKKINVKC
jgi:hypothetical protein